MTSMQETLVTGAAGAVLTALSLVVMYIRHGQGMKTRTFTYVMPAYCAIAFLAFHAGRMGLGWVSTPVLALVGFAIGVAVLVLHHRVTMGILRPLAQTLYTNSAQLAATAKQAASSAVQQAAMVSEVSTTTEELLQTSTAASESANGVMSVTGVAFERSQEGRGTAAEALRIMELISRTNAMLEQVNDLAEQSNLLAVNASIEAAKAGDHGRGFSVVAAEVRNLAEQSKVATRQIREAIQRTDDGRHAIESVAGLIEELSKVLEDASDKAQRISAATMQQSSGVRQITEALQSLSQGGQDAAGTAKQVEEAATALNALGADLHLFVDEAQRM